VRLVFAGTPAVAVAALDALLASRHEVVAVVTRPDAPAGRGRHVEPSPVAVRAAEAGLEVLKPAKVRDPEFLDYLTKLAPDCCPVTAYGALLPQSALDIPRHGWVNLHFSLLPAWRGAAPVQHAIMHGDDITGATTFRIVKELDAGPVYGMVTEPVLPGDTTGDLLARLAESGSQLLVATLDGISDGTLTPVPQPAEGVSLAPKITVEDARADWTRPAYAVDRLVRACTPDPGAWTPVDGGRLKLWPLNLDGAPGSLAPGEIHAERNAVYVGTGTTPVRLGDVQPPGKRRMPAADWTRGLRGELPRLGADGSLPPGGRPPGPYPPGPRAPGRVRRSAGGRRTRRLRQPAAALHPGRARDQRPGRRARH
jgi:methionyl-tRNA formyltransferase